MTHKFGLDALLAPQNSVLVLIDHQPFQLANVNSHEPTLVINNVPCGGRFSCGNLLPVMLPEGCTVTVHAPNYRRRLTGGAQP